MASGQAVAGAMELPSPALLSSGKIFYFYVMNLYGYHDGRGNLIVVRARTKTNAQGRLMGKGYAALYRHIFVIKKQGRTSPTGR